MLQSRLAALHALLSSMSSGTALSSQPWCFLSGCCVADHMLQIAGDTPYDHGLVRQAASLVRQLPAIRASSFNKDFLMVRSPTAVHTGGGNAWRVSGVLTGASVMMVVQDFNDAMLTVFMSGMTNGVNIVNDMVEKVNIAYDRSIRRRSAF